MAKGWISLSVYDGDSSGSTYRTKIRDGHFFITGQLTQTAVAELNHSGFNAPLVFMIDPTTITMEIDEGKTEQSRIKGCKSNSEYRIIREEWIRSHSNDLLNTAYAPLLLYYHSDEKMVLDHFDKLVPHPTTKYHFNLLKEKKEALAATTEGGQMPDVVFVDNKRRRQHLDSLRNDSLPSLFIITASYCHANDSIVWQARQSNLSPIVYQIDDDKRGWDSPCLKQLSVDHIPFLILIDVDGTILARDLRQWEIAKTADYHFSSKKKTAHSR